MFHVVLYHPEIPPNTGNAIRLCANAGATLHLIHPLGFELDDARMRRAGLDYHELARLREHESLEAFRRAVAPPRLFALATRAGQFYHEAAYRPGDAFLFGPEPSGLPEEVIGDLPTDALIRIPMRPGNRSLNLSNAVAVTVYEAWRQQSFDGAL